MTSLLIPKGIKNNNYLKVFFLGLFLAFLLFMPYIIKDGGRFLFYGDFNVQQVPFYRIAHDAVVGGQMGWNQYTDLGANFIGSYSFYLLGSPFFWITLPFPGEAIQYLMGPLLILKFACAALTSFIFLKRYVKNQTLAIAGAILYAFSGFSVYNIFFNHFHEAIIFFPLLLAAIDEYMATRRRGIVALAVFGCCLVNYYFFVGQVVFCIIYFFVRLFTGSYKVTIKDFLFLALEAFMGLGLACILLVPSIFAIMQNGRVDNPINGWAGLVYNKPQRYIHILECFFFPPDLPARPNFTPDSESKWASLGAWLPLFGMTGVIGWLQQRKKHWLKKMLYILAMCALIPLFNSAFQLFNASYYARWFYTITLMMSLATIMSLENVRTNWKRAIKWTAVITGAIAVAIGAMPYTVETDGKESLVIGLEKYPTRFWSYVAISFICLAVLIFLFRYITREKFNKGLIISLSIVAVLYSSFFIATGKTQSLDPYDHLIPYALNGGKNVPLDDLQTVRSDFYDSLDNSGMFWKIPNIQAFHSIVPGSIMSYYDYIGVQRDVGSRPETSNYSVRALTSVRWLFDDDHDEEYFAGKDYDNPLMPSFVYYGNANGFDIWENESFIPMGFTYDSYVLKSEVDSLSEQNRQLIMLKAAVIPDEDESVWKNVLKKYKIETASYTESQYISDCTKRAEIVCNNFEYTQKGFEASIKTGKDTAVFFSIPYEQGWSAKVNGEEARILKTNIGFMSVMISQGDEVRISFTYNTPGLNIGVGITVISLFALLVYIYVFHMLKKKGKLNVNNTKKRFCKKFSSYALFKGATFKSRNSRGFIRTKNKQK